MKVYHDVAGSSDFLFYTPHFFYLRLIHRKGQVPFTLAIPTRTYILGMFSSSNLGNGVMSAPTPLSAAQYAHLGSWRTKRMYLLVT